MTFSATAPAKELANALAICARIAPKNSTGPILSNAKLEARDGKLVIGATSLDQHVEVSIDCQCSGATTAPAAMLASITAKFVPHVDVKLSMADNQLLCVQGRTRTKVPTLPAQDLPITIDDRQSVHFDVKSADLIAAIGVVRGGVADEEVRYYLTGAYLDAKGKAPHLVATDGKVMASTPLPFIEASRPPGVIIPEAALAHITTICAGAETVRCRASERAFGVEVGPLRYETKVIDGTFPEWRKFIRKDGNPTKCTLARVDVERLVDLVGASSLRYVRFEFDRMVKCRGDADLKQTPDAIGLAASDELESIAFLGEPVSVCLNHRQLRWAIQTLRGKTIEFGAVDGEAWVEMRDPDGDQSDVRILSQVRV